MTSHFSLNIKTLSAKTNAMVLSVAICKFDADTDDFISTHFNLDLDEQAQRGRSIDTSRLHWWLKQAALPDYIPFGDTKYWPVREGLRYLNSFILEHGSIPPDPSTPVNFIWVRGTQFDWAILENLSHEFDVGLPFRHNSIRDQRTFCDDYVEHKPIKTRDAMCDAVYHAKQIQKTLGITGQPLK